MTAQPFRILFVDDDPLALSLVQRVFRDDARVKLTTTASPNEAVVIAMREQLDLVVTDQRMSEMTGLQLLARLRELQPEALRILVTAYPEISDALMGINEGLLYRFVLKPWDPEDMQRTVGTAMETRRARLERDASLRHLSGGRERGGAARPAGGQRLRTVVAEVQKHAGELIAATRALPAAGRDAGLLDSQSRLEKKIEELSAVVETIGRD